MTRSITIVNTSNWEREDYNVTVDGKPYYLKPGSSVEVTPDTVGSVQIEEIEPTGMTVPFYLHASVERDAKDGVRGVKREDKQVFPKVTVSFE